MDALEMALNQAEAIASEETWLKLDKYADKSFYTDSDVGIDLKSKTIGDLSQHVSTEGEQNSQYISFIMDRYYDGVDLTLMTIQVQYEHEDGSGSTDGVVNAYASSSQIRFGWVVPPAASKVGGVIKIIVFCTGSMNCEPYTLKTKPIQYPLNSTLEIGGSVPEPDKNWYLQFVDVMSQRVAEAVQAMESAKESEELVLESLTAAQNIQSDVSSSKSTVQTLTAQVQSNTTKAQESSDAAKVSEQNAASSEASAKMYAENASAVTGVQIAKQDIAGLVKGGDVYIAEDGTIELTRITTDRELKNSHPGGLKINSITGAPTEQGSTTGAQLFDKDNAKYATGVNVQANNKFGATTSTVVRMYYVEVEPNTTYTFSKELGTFNRVCTCPEIPVAGGLITSVNTDTSNNVATITTGGNDKYIAFYPLLEAETANITYDELLNTIMLNTGSTVLPWELYTGGKPSPSTEYPQKIKSVKGKNLLKNTATSKNAGGITFTVNNDGSVKVNGTNTNTGQVDFRITEEHDILNAGNYIFSGLKSGASGVYAMQLSLRRVRDDESLMLTVTNVEIETMLTEDYYINYARIIIQAGVTVPNVTFYPMLRPASIADDTYVPYGLLRVKTSGKNLLKNIVTSSTHRGVNYVVNEDKSITIKGTATELGWRLIGTVLLDTGTYIVSGCPNGGSIDGYRVDLRYDKDGQSTVYPESIDYGDGAKITITEPTTVHYAIRLMTNVNYNNLTFYPMIRDASIEDDTYEPYQEKSIILSNPITLNGHNGVQDRIVRKDGVWGIERNTTYTRILTPESKSWAQAGTAVDRYYLKATLLVDDIGDTAETVLCTHFIDSTTAETVGEMILNTQGYMGFAFAEKGTSSAEEFTQFLEDNEVYVLAVKATPTFEPLPTADQIALNSLVSFDGVTYLYIDSEIEPTIDVEYGTSKVGGYTLECYNDKEVIKLEVAEMKAAQTTTEEVIEE